MNVINTLGKKRAIEIFQETKNIEKKGGMLIMVSDIKFNFHGFLTKGSKKK